MKFRILPLLVFACSRLFSQVTEKEFGFLSSYYNDQYKKLINARGIDTTSYFKSKYINQNDPSKISSVLKNYFGRSNARIAALIYFYYDSTLFVYLADKESVRKMGSQKVSYSSVTGLNARVINSLKLTASLQNRSPHKRGAQFEDDIAPEDFNAVNSYASSLLIPDTSVFNYDHLIIVPCLNLGAFPFYLLKINDRYFVDRLSYSIAPSLIEVEAHCKKNEARIGVNNLGNKIKYNFQKPLLVADPQFPTGMPLEFPDLPGAKKEVEGSLKYFEGIPYTYYTGAAATKKNIMNQFSSHDLLYFATHGVSSSSNPLDSCFLVLGGNEQPFLTNREILKYFDSTTNMDLVILSACQTGLGKSMDAGIIGLSRAFQIAGANHVVMSLWSVDDEATAFMMQQFLMWIQFESNFFPAEPLRKAILATKKRFPDPSQWASFALFGVPY